MDKLSVHQGQHNGVSKPPVHHGKGKGKGKGGGGGGGKGIKVVYISSPYKLTASAEEFRAVVQELTGRDSNVADHDAPGVPSYYSSSSSSSYSSFGRASPPTTAGGSMPDAGARALPPAMVSSSTPEYMTAAGAMPSPFQSVYDQTGSTGQFYGQDYYW
uniref:Uncharacterized protein n=1 Tax=Avena sativa TaxID=4498 RepID=A0ACD5XL03_AVESA